MSGIFIRKELENIFFQSLIYFNRKHDNSINIEKKTTFSCFTSKHEVAMQNIIFVRLLSKKLKLKFF